MQTPKVWKLDAPETHAILNPDTGVFEDTVQITHYQLANIRQEIDRRNTTPWPKDGEFEIWIARAIKTAPYTWSEVENIVGLHLMLTDSDYNDLVDALSLTIGEASLIVYDFLAVNGLIPAGTAESYAEES